MLVTSSAPVRAHVEKVFEKTTRTPSCWIYTGFKTEKGYGLLGVGSPRKLVRAHRVVYEELVGPIPEGLQLDHLCRERACVHPGHLEPVTPRQNVLRGAVPKTSVLHAALPKRRRPERGQVTSTAPVRLAT